MSNDVGTNGNGTPRNSHLSPSSAVVSPSWGRPRSPLPPHRLAKLANALGVSTPMPAVHQPASFKSRSFSDTPSPLDSFRRSPTPSTPASNFSSYTSSVTKFLLHVIPPLHLPHEYDDDTDVTPPPPTASGYHTQFRRGTLVPMHPSFQSQLGAIAKEYALPSTAGLILYLVSSAKNPHERSLTPSLGFHGDDLMDEPGPRLSEDIWKHLWTRVVKIEQRDDHLLLPSPVSNTPGMFGLAAGAQSTPFLLHESNGQPLRPFISTNGIDRGQPQPSAYSFTPSPSTPSSGSDLRSNTKSAPPSSSSISQSEPETPDTSSGSHEFNNDPATRANSLDLPGLHSSSIIPILAKVEFDIDRRKAAWYDPWLRSRRMNHAKRTESRTGRKASVNEGAGGPDVSPERHRPISLLIGRKETASPASFVASSTHDQSTDSDKESESISVPTSGTVVGELSLETNGYEQLPETQGDDSWSDEGDSDEDEFEDEFTARVAPGTGSQDPLADVFGDDGDTWASMQGSTDRNSKRETNPNIVELSLTGADLTRLPSPTDSEFEYLGKEEDEVQALLDKMLRPQLSVSIPSLPPEKRSSSPSGRKGVPPPLVLVPSTEQSELVVPNEASPLPSSAGSTSLAYLNDSSPDCVSGNQEQEEGLEDDSSLEKDYTRVRSPAESEKRGGAVFDDLDLGLDPSEDFDDNDPHDRRRSQYLMRAQLDEIERTMAQLSPRILQVDLEEEQSMFMSSTLSPNNSVTLSPGMMNGDFYPPSPRLPQHPTPEDDDSHRDSSDSKRAAWPAVPFSSLSDQGLTSPPLRPDGPPSPPRLAVNGVTTSAPRSYVPQRSSTSEISAETEKRKRELEEEQGYPVLTPSVGRGPTNPSDSPIIPLSPDPFGRYSSTPEPPPGSRQTSAYWDNPPKSPLSFDNNSGAAPRDTHDRSRSHSSATSRFSADSLTGEEPIIKPTNRSTLMTVNTIKKFWRKSNKSSSTSTLPPTQSTVGRSSTQLQRPERPSEDEGTPKTPILGRFSPQLVPPRPSQEQMLAPQPQQLPIPQQLQQPPTSFNGRSPNPGPIVAAQMQPGRGGSTLDRLHFDQESPYPTRRAPYPSRPSSPPALPSPSPQTSDLPLPNIPPPALSTGGAPLLPEKEKPSVRKSILKSWKSATASISQSAPPLPEPRSSIEPRASTERPNANGTRGRRPSVLNFGSTRGSASPDIPTSPPIPHQYLDQRNDRRQSTRSRIASPSIDSSHSPPQVNRSLQARSSSQRSTASSRDSQETRPSFDVSQFEIVSPKMNSTLSYPYHGLDH
ncbi:hypothetical protein BDZ94DRAFT_1243073, partial [Collybia nuda]